MPTGQGEIFRLVSSTSVLDTEHYVGVPESLTKSSLNGISEADDLQGSHQGLSTGYGQSKWVAEYIVREAGNQGLRGGIVRPSYVLEVQGLEVSFHIPAV